MHVQHRPALGLCIAIVICMTAWCAPVHAQVPGANVNMVSGTQWPGGDPFLQRQNEPSLAVSSRNPFHILAGANDYRSVDLALTTNGETGDAWLGLFKSLDGGNTWRSILLPGCPYNTPVCGGAPAVKNAGYQAAADPTVRAGTNGMFYYAGLVFNRGVNPHSAIVVSRLIDLNNKENADPNDILNGDAIQFMDTSIVASGTSSQFLDKPTLAVDVPRVGATTCNISVNQPGNGQVRQSFPAGNVYVAYTAFAEAANTDPETVTTPQPSTIFLVRSTNCGLTWSAPKAISTAGVVNQGAVIAINPLTGGIFVAWRQFHFQSGNINQPDAMVGVTSNDGGQTFSAPVQISTFSPFDEGTTNTSFRTNAYPTAAYDGRSRVYVTYSARNTVPSGDARIVMTSSLGGALWTKPILVDNPAVDPLSNPSGRGHQIMPTLTFAAGRLSLLYYDLRLDHTFGLFSPLLSQGQPSGLYTNTPEMAGELGLSPPLIGAVFNQFIDDSTITLRRHTFDLRMAQALPGITPVFAPSVLVSQYAYGCCATNQSDIEQLQFNAPNLPLFRSGTAPFMGDYVDLAPGPLIIPPQNTSAETNDGNADDDDWAFNVSPSTPTSWHAAWTDNRDVQAPADGDWTHYTPPNSPSLGATSIFQPGTATQACQAGFTGSRNQNIYTAPISGGLVFGAPANTKQLGTTIFNGQTVPFQRAFALVAQNATNLVKSFRLTIANQPVGGNASFLQFAQLTTLDLSIPALSSATRPVFVTSTNPAASVTVTIAEITAPSGTLVPNGLTSSTTLNPDPTNPAITNPAITNPAITNPAITNFEVTNPAITNPAITNPAITNPAITNPAITNPAITNSTFQNVSVVNPAITNPAITNPAITNASVANPAITNPAITNVNPANTSVTDTQWTVSNNGNTEGSFTINLASTSNPTANNVLQLIISKLYQTPAAPTGQNCNLGVETHNTIVTNIVRPTLFQPTDPAITNPAITNPAITNATVALAPGETANIIVRVVNTDTTQPTFNPAASVAPVAVAQAVPTQTALSVPPGGTPPPPPVTVPPLQIATTTLPDAVSGAAYSASVQTTGGNPTAHTFTVISGGLPGGLGLNAATGAITGIVTAAGPSSFSFTVQVQDVGSTTFPQHTTTQSLTIRVGARLVFSPLTLPQATQGANYSQNISVSGGLGTILQTIVSGNPPPGLTLNNATGLISGFPTATGPFSFTVQAADSATPPQTAVQSYTINVVSAAQAAANVTFLTQPANSIGGQTLAGSPVIVQVTDVTGAVIPNANVTMSFIGTPPCSAAVLSGTLTQTTTATGQASFPDLSIDRGQLGYKLQASIGNVSATSNPFTVNGFCATGSMATARALLTTVTLPNGKVLVAGGAPAFSNQSAISGAELYDPVTHSFTSAGNMNSPRNDLSMAVLQNGLVLIAGGFNSSGNLSSAELFDPGTNTFTPIPSSMIVARSAAATTVLANGKVLITGGNGGNVLASAEIFDPATNTFTATSHPMTTPRVIHEAILLPNGKVLITGGFSAFGPNGPINPLASAELYDPVSDTFTATGSMSIPRYEHASALMSNGKVLVSGGDSAANFSAPSATAEIYDPTTGIFTATTTAPQVLAGFLFPVPVLADGSVFLYGESYDPASATYRSTGPSTIAQAQPNFSLLNDGTILVVGGVGSPTFDAGLTTAEVYYSTAPLAPMQITTTALAPGATGQPFTQVLLQHGGVGNLIWTLTGTLPSGLAFSNQGILIGTPTIAGSFPLTFTLTNSSAPAKIATANLTLTVTNSQLAFVSNTVPTAVAGRPYAQVLPVAGGTQPYNSTITAGTLPPGMVVAGNMLTGTPTGSGNFTFTVSVTDSSSPAQTATQTFTMSVDTLVITTAVLPSGIVGVPYNAAINTAGGTLPLSFSLANTSFPQGLLIQQPGPGSSSGALAGTPTQAGTFTFSESVADSSNPQQTATQNYVVTIAPAGSAVPASVTFVTEPQNSVGSKTLSGGPLIVRVADAANNPIPNTIVTMTLMGIFGTPLSCPVAALNGTLSAVTDGTGQARFSNLSIDRGGYNFALLASTGSASGSSGPFSVQGFCGSANLSTQREGHTQDVLGTAFTRKFPLDPAGTYLFTNNNPAPGGTPDNPHPPLIISLAQFNVKPGDIISGVPVGDEDPCGVGQFCSGEIFTPFTCAVFSSSNTLLPAGGVLNRVPGAIAPDFSTAFTCNTGNTAFGNLPTDIPQDFALLGERVTVPPGAQFLFVGISDVFYADNLDPNGDLGVAFTLNSTTSANSKILIAGGVDNLGNALKTAELYDPALNFTQPTGNLTAPNGRFNHVSVVLPDQRVLLVGGADNSGAALATAEIYDPSTGTFSQTGSMSQPRGLPAAALLADGRVLVSGGLDASSVLNTVEIFDPNTGLFTPTGSMNQSRTRHAMTLLPNGKVLVTGGRDAAVNFFALNSAEIFDPYANGRAGAFTPLPNMNSPRFKHTSTLLTNGTVLIAGGFSGDINSVSVASAEIFDFRTNTFTPTGSMNTPRARHAATALPDGTVLMTGGINAFNGILPAAPAELYSPGTGTFSATGSMITGRELPAATLLLPNGNVLVSGGDNGVDVLSTTETYFNTIAQAPIAITTASLPNGVISQPYVQLLLSQNKTGPIFWSLASGALPPGVNLIASGVLIGTPTTTGSFTFTLQVTDGISTASATYTVNVSLSTLAFTGNAMPTAGAGKPYSQPLPVTGGKLPYAATLTGGSLPSGLSLSSTGVLSGTPTSAGSFTFTVSVTDSSAPAQTATQTLTIAVDTLFITTTALPSGIVGVPYNAAISTTGGTLPLTFSPADASFPPSMLIQQPAANSHSGALVGTPTQAGHYTFTESVTDSSNPAQTVSQYYTMDIFPTGSIAAPAHVTFLRQPQNSVGGQVLAGSPIVVNVTDANNQPVLGASVSISFNGAPPCSTAVLSGTLSGNTGQNGNAAFTDLSIDRGQLGYTLLASTGSASAISQPFTVNGFCPTSPMNVPRVFHTAVTLANGTVLVAGGANPSLPLASAELYDPSTRKFNQAGAMNVPRWGHTATLLRDGRVLIAGGVNSTSNTIASVTNTAEIFDPSTNTFTLTQGTMSSARYVHTATLLPDGRVLIAAGGTAVGTLAGVGACLCTASSITNTAEIFDPATGLFTPTVSNLAAARQVATATLLPNGQVLIAGGGDTNPLPLASTELFDPPSGRFLSAAAMSIPRELHAASLLPTGKVFVAGGDAIVSGNFTKTQTAELYDPASNTFALTASLATGRDDFSTELLPDGTVLLAGGESVQGTSVFTPASAELFSPINASISATGNISSPRAVYASTLLKDGTVLLTGGGGLAAIFDSAEVYYSTAPLAPIQITTSSALPQAITGQPYTQLLLEQGGVGTLTWTQPGGSLPSGFKLTADGILLGTPTVPGTFTFTVQLTDSSTPAKITSATFTLIVKGGALVFGPQSLPTAIVGSAYTPSLVATGGTSPLSFAVTAGTPPAGITLGANGTFTGSPTAAGTSTFTVTVTDSSSPQQSASQSVTVQVANPLAITTASLPNGTVGTFYNQAVVSTGGLPPAGFAVTSGTPPTGLTLASNGVLTGTPTAAGSFTFTVTATDGSTPPQTASQSHTITIAPAVAQAAHVAFVDQPQNAIAGQVIVGHSPLQVQVLDTNSLPVPNTPVTMSFNGAPPCATATLSGTLTQTTDATGTASFPDLTINRGQFLYTLAATAGAVSAVSTPFNVEGFCPTATPGAARFGATATLLPNGKVLLTGGIDAGAPATVVATAELYDPIAHTLTPTGNMNVARTGHTATLLPDGRVLIAGGNSTVGPAPGFQPGPATSTSEFYDSAIGAFSPGADVLNVARTGHTATLLNDGTVLIAGGIGGVSGNPLDSAEIFHPGNGSGILDDAFTALSTKLSATRALHSATLLTNGQVLIAGGYNATTANNSADIFDPVAQTFTATANMAFAHAQHTATLLPDGRVAIIGGVDASNNAETNVELFNPALLNFSTSAAALNPTAREVHSATLLPNGTILVTGGFDFNLTALNSAEIFNPATDTSTPTGSMQSRRSGSATLLNDGTVFVAGGAYNGTPGFNTQTLATLPAEIFYPGNFVPLSITTILPTALQNTLYTQQLQQKGGLGTLNWIISSGTPPAGLTLSTSGLLSGTPTAVGVSQFTVQVTDSSTPPQATTTTFLMAVVPPLTLLPILPPANPGVAYSQPLIVVGGASPYTFSLISGALPAGFNLDTSSGVVSGTTAATGTFTFSVRVTDSSTPAVTVTQAVQLTVAPPGITLVPDGPLLGVGRSFNATAVLNQPAPTGGVVVTLVSSDTSVATVSPATVTIPAGAVTATFTLTGVNTGTVTLTASAPNLANGTATLTVTASLISLQSGTLVVAPGQSSSLAVSLSSPAGPGGVTINFVSANTAVATVTPSIFVPQGAQTGATNPQVTGAAIGSTFITAAAIGFAQDTSVVQVTVSASFSPDPLNVPSTRTNNILLNISAAAPQPNGITFNLSTDNTAFATVPLTASIPAGQVSVSVPVTGVAVGTAHISASSSGIATASATINVGTAPGLSINVTTSLGKDLQADNQSISLGAVSPANEALTLTSNSPNLLIADNPAGPFSQSITLQLSLNSSSSPLFSMQSLASTGSPQLTASATGFSNGSITVNLTPSGITWFNGNFPTTTFSADTTLTLLASQLNPNTLGIQAFQNVRTGASLSVTVTSSDATVGTIVSSPITFTPDTNSATVQFHPVAPGTANLVIATPSGFSTPTGTNATSITATVSAPNITVNTVTNLGQNLQADNQSISLGAPPPSNRSLTLTSNSPNLLIANSPSGPFSQSITLQLLQGSLSVPTFSVQSLSGTGTPQLTASASGYNNGVDTVNLTPSGIDWFSGPFNTTTFSADTNLTLIAAQLNPSTLTVQAFQNVRTGFSLSVTVTSSDTTIGTVTSPVAFASDANTATLKFHPVAAGAINLVITTPAGFTAPSGTNATSIAVNVSAPNITVNATTNLGQNLQVDNQSISLAAAPPTSRTLTLTSNSTNLLVANSPSGPFSQSITLQLTGGSFSVGTFSMQSLASTGTGQLTASASGYNDGVDTVTLTPSAIEWFNGPFSTTTFSADSNLTLIAAQLAPGTLNLQSFQNVRTGLTVSVTVTSSDPTIGTIVSPVSIAPDSNSATTKFHPLTAGTTNLVITTPTGFTTPSGVNTTSIAATVSAPTLSINAPANLGQNLQVDNQSISLGAAPPNNETLTLTSSTANVLLANSAAGPFSQSITLQLTKTSTAVPNFSVQALGVTGSAQLTAQAPGYTDGVLLLTVTPSGIVWFSGSFGTTSFSADSTLTLIAAQLNPNTLAVQSFQSIRNGLSVSVTLTSSDTTVGTIVSPVTIAADTLSITTKFHPVSNGAANLVITTPAGFTAPTGTNATSITATVSAPNISINVTNLLGQNLQVDNQSISLGAAPPTDRLLTLTSNSPNLLISSSAAGPFSQSITLQLTGGSLSVPTFSVQSLAGSGSGQLTASASGYNTDTVVINLTPSAIMWFNGNFNTTTSAANTSLTLIAAQLNAGTLTLQSFQSIRTGLNVSVIITSSDPTVGTVVSPVTLPADTNSITTTFHPVAAGNATLSITTPSGFATPNPPSATSITATVQ